MVALPELIFWLPNLPEPMILQWAKVVTIIPLTINSQDKSNEDYRPGPQEEEEGYGTASAQQDHIVGLSAEAERQGHPLLGFSNHLLTVKFRQPSHEFTFGVGITFIPYPLVLPPLV
jgi:hypothetical protein